MYMCVCAPKGTASLNARMTVEIYKGYWYLLVDMVVDKDAFCILLPLNLYRVKRAFVQVRCTISICACA